MLKSEIAEKFYHIRTRTLIRWINSNPKLIKELEQNNYKSRNKVITPLQISIIRKYLG